MNTTKPTLTATKSLEAFEEGQLCYVVLRKYKGNGVPTLILHEAKLLPGEDSFGYGAFRHWVVSPSKLLGMATSDKKSKSSAKNGKKGGRPKNK